MKKVILISVICSFALFSLAGCCETGTASNEPTEIKPEYSDAASVGESDFESGSSSAADGEEISGSDDSSQSAEDGDSSSEDSSSAEYDSPDSEEEENDSDIENGDSDEIAAAVVGAWTPYAAYKTGNPDQKVSMHTFFGDGFSFGGTLNLNPDFSFIDTTLGTRTGTYSVSGKTITLSYHDGETASLQLTGYPNNSSLEREKEVGGESCTVYYTM